MTLMNSVRVAWRSRDAGPEAVSAGGSRRPVGQGLERLSRSADVDIPSAFDPMRRASKMLREWTLASEVRALVFAPDGRHLAAGGDHAGLA